MFREIVKNPNSVETPSFSEPKNLFELPSSSSYGVSSYEISTVFFSKGGRAIQ